MEIDTNGFALGDRVRDPITGLEGTIVAFHQWLTGCARASVQPKVKGDGKVPEAYGVDVTQLELREAARSPAASGMKTGGPRPEPRHIRPGEIER